MRLTAILAASLSLAAIACQSTSTPDIVRVDAASRDVLLTAVSALEGRWVGPEHEGRPQVSEFAVIAEGSAVREIMHPGDTYEMTNMYALDGNSLVMTHYCAGGNQPRMRASALTNGRIVFRTDGVSDLKSEDEVYMGAMTLVIVDDDHIEQRWSALKAGEPDHDMVIKLTRVR